MYPNESVISKLTKNLSPQTNSGDCPECAPRRESKSHRLRDRLRRTSAFWKRNQAYRPAPRTMYAGLLLWFGFLLSAGFGVGDTILGITLPLDFISAPIALVSILGGIFVFTVILKAGGHLFSHLVTRHQRSNLLKENNLRGKEWRNHILLARWRTERVEKKTTSCSLPFKANLDEDSPASARNVRYEINHQYPTPPAIPARVRHSQTPGKTIGMGVFLLALFSLQMILSTPGIQNMFTSSSYAVKPQAADAADPAGWLCLNNDEIMASTSGRFSFFATNNSWIIAEIENCELAEFSLMDGGETLHKYSIQPGAAIYDPFWFKNETWADGVPNEQENHQYILQIDLNQAQYYKTLAVLPQTFVYDNNTVDMDSWHEVSFWATERVHVLLNGNFSITELAAYVQANSDGTIWTLKRNDYEGSENYPMDFSSAASITQDNKFLQFDLDLPSDSYKLFIQGNGTCESMVLSDGDWDQDGQSDVDEVQVGWDMVSPDVWGRRTVFGSRQSYQEMMDDLMNIAIEWEKVEFEFYISPVFSDANHLLFADAYNGEFTNFSVSEDPYYDLNFSLSGFQSDSMRAIRFINEDQIKYAPENEFYYTDTKFIGEFGTGAHTLVFYQKYNPFNPPSIGFRDNFQNILELDVTSATNELADFDNDGLIDGLDKESMCFLDLNPGTALRLAIPYTYEDRQNQADLRISFQVKPPVTDYSTQTGPLVWHDGEGEFDEGVKCQVIPVLRLFGTGPAGDDNWYDNDMVNFDNFWDKSIITKSLVSIDAAGGVYDGTSAPWDILPVPRAQSSTDTEDPTLGYYTFIYPELSNKSWNFNIDIAEDQPILDTGHVTLVMDFAWQVWEENPYNHSLSLIHVYDVTEPIKIQSVVATYFSSVRYTIGAPTSYAEYLAIKSLTENPACVINQPAGASPLSQRILKTEENVGLFPKFYYDKDDYTTYSLSDRISYWRKQSASVPVQSEVIFYCSKEKTIDVLQKLEFGTTFDTCSDPSTVMGNEIQFGDFFGTWSFNDVPNGVTAPNLDGSASFVTWDGNERVFITDHIRHFRKVLEFAPEFDAQTYTSLPALAAVNMVNPADHASVEFWIVLGKRSGLDMGGTFDIRILDPADNTGPWLRFDGEQVQYGYYDDIIGGPLFETVDDVGVWPEEPIHVSIWYNCTNQSFFVNLGGVTDQWFNSLPFYNPAVGITQLQYTEFEANYAKAYVDAIGFTQESHVYNLPTSMWDKTYNCSDNVIWYSAWHAGDNDQLVSWTQINNISQSAFASEDLQGDFDVLWAINYQEYLHNRKLVEIYALPLQVGLTRAGDSDDDGFEMSHFAQVLYADGLTALNNIPATTADVTPWAEADENIRYVRTTSLELVQDTSSQAAFVNYNPNLIDVYETTLLRERERDWWNAYYRPGSWRVADIDWSKFTKKELYSLIQEARFDIVAKLREKLKIMKEVDPNFKMGPYPLTDWSIELVGNKLWWCPEWEGETINPYTGEITPVEADSYGIYYRKPHQDAVEIDATSMDPNVILKSDQPRANRLYFKQEFSLVDFENWVNQVEKSFKIMDEMYKSLTGVPKKFRAVTYVEFKEEFKLDPDFMADFEYFRSNPAGLVTKYSAKYPDLQIASLDDFFDTVKIDSAYLKDVEAKKKSLPKMAREMEFVPTDADFIEYIRDAISTKERLTPVVASANPWNRWSLQITFSQPIAKPVATMTAIDLKNMGKPASNAYLFIGGEVMYPYFFTYVPDDTIDPSRGIGSNSPLLRRPLAFAAEFAECFQVKNELKIKKFDGDGATWDKWTWLEDENGFRDWTWRRLGPYYLLDYELPDRTVESSAVSFRTKTDLLFAFAEKLAIETDNRHLLAKMKGLETHKGVRAPRDIRAYHLAYDHSPAGALREAYRIWYRDLTCFTPREANIKAWAVRDLVWLRRKVITEFDGDFRVFKSVSARQQFVRKIAERLSVDESLEYPKKMTKFEDVLLNGRGASKKTGASIQSLAAIFGDDEAAALLRDAKQLIKNDPRFRANAKAKIESVDLHFTDFNIESFRTMLVISPSLRRKFWELYSYRFDMNYEEFVRFIGDKTKLTPLVESDFKPEGGKVYTLHFKGGNYVEVGAGIASHWTVTDLRTGETREILREQSDHAAAETTVVDPWVGDFDVRSRVARNAAIASTHIWRIQTFHETPELQIKTRAWKIESERLRFEMETDFNWANALELCDTIRFADDAIPSFRDIYLGGGGFTGLGLEFLIGLVIDLAQTIPEANAETDRLRDLGVSEDIITEVVWHRYYIPILIEGIVDITIAELVGNLLADTFCTAGSLASTAVTMGVSMIVAVIVNMVWNTYYTDIMQKLADATSELNIGYGVDLVFPEETERNVARHLGLEAGDTVNVQVSVENKGYRYYDTDIFGIHTPENTDDQNEGSAFWWQGAYSVGASGGSMPENWQGNWGSSTPFYEDRTVHNILHNGIHTEHSQYAAGPVTYTYSNTLTAATADLELTSRTQLGIQMGDHWVDRVDFDPTVTRQLISGARVLENSMAEFAAQTVPAQEEKSVAELVSDLGLAKAEYRWKDAAALQTEINGAQAIVTDDRLEELVSRRVELGAPGGPTEYTDAAGNSVEFSEQDLRDYDLLTCLNAAEFLSFFPAPGTAGAYDFVRQGIRALVPRWDSVDLTSVVVDEQFQYSNQVAVTSKGWSFEGNQESGSGLPIAATLEPVDYYAAANPDMPEANRRYGCVHVIDDSNGGSFVLSKSFGESIMRGEAEWEVRPMQSHEDFTMDLRGPAGRLLRVQFTEGSLIQVQGTTVCAQTSMAWYVIHVHWDCLEGYADVWVNGIYIQVGLSYGPSVDNRATWWSLSTVGAGPSSHLDLNYFWAKEIGDYLDGQRSGYYATQTKGQILIPKAWFNQTRFLLDSQAGAIAPLESLPLQTNIAASPSSGEDCITLYPEEVYSGALTFNIEGMDNPAISIDAIVPAGITATWTPQAGFLQDLHVVNFTLSADSSVYAGPAYVFFNVTMGDAVVFQEFIPIRIAYEDSSTFSIASGPILIEPGNAALWATLWNNGTVPQATIATFSGLPEGWVTSDAFMPVATSSFDAGLDGWAGTCSSGLGVESKIYAYAGNLVMAASEAEMLAATFSLPSPVEVRPGDIVRVSLRGRCASGVTISTAGQSYELLSADLEYAAYHEVTISIVGFGTVSDIVITGPFLPGESIWIDYVCLEACTTRYAHELWQTFTDDTALLADYGWSIDFASEITEISAGALVENLAYTDANLPTDNFGTTSSAIAGPANYLFIEIPRYPAALYSFKNFSQVEKILSLLHDPTLSSSAVELDGWVVGGFNESLSEDPSGSYPGITWGTQPSFWYQLGSYNIPEGLDPTWLIVDVSGHTYIALNASAAHRFYSDDAGEVLRPSVQFNIPKAGISDGYLVVQSDITDTFDLTLDLHSNISLSAGDAVRLAFNVTSAMALTLGAGETFTLNPSGSGRYELVLPYSADTPEFDTVTLHGIFPAGGVFSLDYMEIYHVQPFGEILPTGEVSGVYNETVDLASLSGYKPVFSATFHDSSDGFLNYTFDTAYAVNGSLLLQSGTVTNEEHIVKCDFASYLPISVGFRLRIGLRSSPASTCAPFLRCQFYQQQVDFSLDQLSEWHEVTFDLPSSYGAMLWLEIVAPLSEGEYLEVDYLLIEELAVAIPVLFAHGRSGILPLSMSGEYLSAASHIFDGPQPRGSWEAWIYMPYIGNNFSLSLYDVSGNLACRAIFDDEAVRATDGTAFAMQEEIYAFFQHVQVSWDTSTNDWALKINNETVFSERLLLSSTGVGPIQKIQLDIGDSGTYYVDAIQCNWSQYYIGSFVQAVQNASGIGFWLAPGERRLFYVAPTASLEEQSFLALFSDAFTGELEGVYDGKVDSTPSCNIGLSSLSPVTQYCVAGAQVTFTIKVTNDGSVADTFQFSCENLGAATYALTPASVSLKPGQSAYAKLVVSTASVDVNYFAVHVASSRNQTALDLWVLANSVQFTEVRDRFPNSGSFIDHTSYQEGPGGNNYIKWMASAAMFGSPTYSVTIDGESWVSGENWVPGEYETVSIDGLRTWPDGSVRVYTMKISISAGVHGIDASHEIQIAVFPPSTPHDGIAPFIQLGEMRAVYVVGDIVVSAEFTDTGEVGIPSGLDQALLYYTMGDWYSANSVLFVDGMATIPQSGVAVGTLKFFLFAEDVESNCALLDQSGWQALDHWFGEADYTGQPFTVQVVAQDTTCPSISPLLEIKGSIYHGRSFTLQCFASDAGGAGLDWLRAYYRSESQPWDGTRFVEFAGGIAAIPSAALDPGITYYYIVAKDGQGNYAYLCSGADGSQVTYESASCPSDDQALANAFSIDVMVNIDFLAPEIGVPTILATHIDLSIDQEITCPVTDLGGSKLEWARLYYRIGTQAWDVARHVSIMGGTAILSQATWAGYAEVEYYIGASDNAGNTIFRGITGLQASNVDAQNNPFSFMMGANTVVCYLPPTEIYPVATHPADIEYITFVETDRQIIWAVTVSGEALPINAKLLVRLDGVTITSMDFDTNPQDVIFPVRDQEIGDYTYTLWYYDGYDGYEMLDEVLVTAVNPLPSTDPLEDFSCYDHDGSESITWTITDPCGISFGTWEVVCGGNVYDSGTWSEDGTTVTIEMSCQVLGEYAFTLKLNDGLSTLRVVDTVVVTVLDDDLEGPALSVTYTGGETDGEPGSWVVGVTDPSGVDTMSVFLDEVLMGNSPGTYDLTSNAVGSHSCRVSALDADTDRGSADQSESQLSSSITLIDDDLEGPALSVTYTGGETDGEPGSWTVAASDDSGIASMIVYVDGIQVGTSAGSYACPNALSSHSCSAWARDADTDRGSADQCESTVTSQSVTIVDDDTAGPLCSITYTGGGTDGNAGYWVVSASDPSGIGSVVVSLDGQYAGDAAGSYYLSNALGSHNCTVVAYDADNDRSGDQCSTTVSQAITLTDDDTAAPTITMTYSGAATDGSPGSWTVAASDESGFASVIVTIDGVQVGTTLGAYSVASVSNSIGTHTISVTVTDGDQDLAGDQLSKTLSSFKYLSDDDTSAPSWSFTSYAINWPWGSTCCCQVSDLSGVYAVYVLWSDGVQRPCHYDGGTQWADDYYWAYVHPDRFLVYDNDNDRANDMSYQYYYTGL